MSITRSILTVGAMIAVLAFTAGAQEVKEEAKAESPKKLKNQTHCPVMGGEIDKEFYVDHMGKQIYFCCEMCIDKFKEDPEKYMKKL